MTEMVERVARAIADNTLGMSADYEYAARAALGVVRKIFWDKAHTAEFQSDPEYELFHAVREIDEALK